MGGAPIIPKGGGPRPGPIIPIPGPIICPIGGPIPIIPKGGPLPIISPIMPCGIIPVPGGPTWPMDGPAAEYT